METLPCRLLCIDLQIDPASSPEPDAVAIFGARQLLAMGRRMAWTIAHARRRPAASAHSDATDAQLGAMRPLKSERVFFRATRSISDSHGLVALLEEWRGETAFVAAFDHVALLSCLLTCYEQGPRLVLVEDALSPRSLGGPTSIDPFRTAAWRLAAGSTTISGILSAIERNPPPDLALTAFGETRGGMQV
jgi:hypothetical protein